MPYSILPALTHLFPPLMSEQLPSVLSSWEEILSSCTRTKGFRRAAVIEGISGPGESGRHGNPSMSYFCRDYSLCTPLPTLAEIPSHSFRTNFYAPLVSLSSAKGRTRVTNGYRSVLICRIRASGSHPLTEVSASEAW